MKKKNRLEEIRTPIEFQKQYLSDTNQVICPFCFDSHQDSRSSFLQIAPLAQIKNLHKYKSFESVAEIADYLNFADQSYFARFLKKHTSLKPTEFRDKQHG